MELGRRAYVEGRSWRPGPPAYLALLPLVVALLVICVPLLSVASALLMDIGLASTVLLVAVTAYRFAMVRSMVLFYDKDGVWKSSGVFSWGRGVWGVTWRDIEHVEFEKAFGRGSCTRIRSG